MKAKFMFRWMLAIAPSVALTSAAPAIQNPSFESNYNDVFPHYGPIDSWTGGSGVNESGGPFHNPGTEIPDRDRVAFVQGTAALSQEIPGLTPGQQYWVQFWYDARNCCGGTIDITTKIGETEIDRVGNVRAAVLNNRPYYSRSVPFVAEADSALLTFATTASGDATAVFDAVTIVERDTNNVVVLNPSFEASGTIPAVGELTKIPGWTVSGITGVDDGTAGQASSENIPEQQLVAFIQGAGSLSQTLAGLVVGETYQVALSYNAKPETAPHIQVKVGDAVLFEEDVTAASPPAAYKSRTVSFVATDLSAILTIAQSKDGADVLLVDNVRVVGEASQPLPPLEISPVAAELAPGQRVTVSIKVPTELLAIKSASLGFRSQNTNVMRLLGASEDGILTLNFAQGATNVQTFEVEAMGRGPARLEVVEAAGLTVERDLAVTVITSFVRNPSFESSAAPAGVGYGAILAWNTPPGGVGINRAAGPFHDNGAIPDREQVAFLQNTATISQEIAGLSPGKKYWLQFFYNARDCCGGTINLEVRFAGQTVTNIAQIAPAGDVNPYHFVSVELSPSAPSGLLEFASTAQGDATVLLDAVNIVQRDAGEIVIKNPSFEASGTPASVGYVQPGNLAGWDASGAGRGINIDGAGPFSDNGRGTDQDLIAFLQSPGTTLSQALSGFEAGQDYTLIFDVNGRSCCGPEPTAYRVAMDDTVLVEEEITPVGAANPYISKYLTFTAAATDSVLKFEHTSPVGDHTLLLDNVRIVKGRVVQAPRLRIAAGGTGEVQIRWPSDSAFVLQSTSALPGGWTAVSTTPTLDGSDNLVIEPITGARKYYRLVSP